MPVDSPEGLYGLPLQRFIPERDALVRALRSEKRRDQATAVARMRKPSVAAWAVNQLVRTQSKAIQALFEAGDDLARAQAGASGERTADALRVAARRQGDTLGGLLRAAKGLLSPEGHPLTATTLERVTETLRAASIDAASREQVAGGCLPRELRFAGMGIGDLAVSPVESPPPQATKPKQRTNQAAERRSAPEAGEAKTADDSARKADAERTRNARAVREADASRQRKAALNAARQTEAESRRAATRAEKALAAARARRAEAAASLEQAEQLLAAASKRAEETAGELGDAERALSDLDDA